MNNLVPPCGPTTIGPWKLEFGVAEPHSRGRVGGDCRRTTRHRKYFLFWPLKPQPCFNVAIVTEIPRQNLDSRSAA
jgi:hypothetical protein